MKNLLLSAFLLGGCTSTVNYQHLSMTKAKKFIDEKDCVVLDVRTPAEYEDGHIKDAVLLPVDEINAKAEEFLSDKDANILIYCRSGRRAKKAAMKLVDLGYSHVYEFGGIIDWPYEIVM